MSGFTPLRVVSESNCGNAPRHEIARRLAIALATADQTELASLLAPTAEWMLLGETTRNGLTSIVDFSARFSPPTELRILSIITHGREASIDGETLSADGQLTNFCHVLRFANTAKTAPITIIRTYQATQVP